MLKFRRLLQEINADDGSYAFLADGYSRESVQHLKGTDFDRVGMGAAQLALRAFGSVDL